MKVLQVNGTWDANGSFKVRNLQHISPSSSQPDIAEPVSSDGVSTPSNYNDWNTVTNILKLIIQSLLLYQSQDGYIYVSADGYAYTNKR